MNVIVDAQLPPKFAAWLTQRFSVHAIHISDTPLASASDLDIFMFARSNDYVIISKDEDFADLVTRLGPPPSLLHIRVGNTTTRALIERTEKALATALALLQSGESIVEIA